MYKLSNSVCYICAICPFLPSDKEIQITTRSIVGRVLSGLELLNCVIKFADGVK